jgi:prepilin-type N-terminal cleavage/methylation domain-containing protein
VCSDIGRAARVRLRPGFSLIEVMIAIILASAGLLALSSAMSGINARQMRIASRLEMTELVDSRFEQFRAIAVTVSPDTVQLSIGGSLTESLPNHSAIVTSARGRQYRMRWAVRNGPGETRHVLLRIEPVQATRHTLPRLDFETLIIQLWPRGLL